MKTLIKSIFIASVLIIATSCEDEEDRGAEGTTISAPLSMADTKISVFDVNKTIQLDLHNDHGFTVNSVEVHKGGSKITDATVSGNTATFNSSTLGTLKEGDINLDFLASLQGGGAPSTALLLSQPLTVAKAITLTEKVDQIIYKDTASNNKVTYETYTAGATIDDVIVTWKNTTTGTETDISAGFEIAKGTIDLKERDYIDYGLVIGDTLIYTFVATSGALRDTVQAVIPIVAQAPRFTSNAQMSTSEGKAAAQMDLITGGTFPEGADDGHIMIDNGGMDPVSGVDIQFVEVSATGGADFYNDYNDLEQMKADFDAGTPTSLTIKPRVYAYKLVVDTKEYYGAIYISKLDAIDIIGGGIPTATYYDAQILSKGGQVME